MKDVRAIDSAIHVVQRPHLSDSGSVAMDRPDRLVHLLEQTLRAGAFGADDTLTLRGWYPAPRNRAGQ